MTAPAVDGVVPANGGSIVVAVNDDGWREFEKVLAEVGTALATAAMVVAAAHPGQQERTVVLGVSTADARR